MQNNLRLIVHRQENMLKENIGCKQTSTNVYNQAEMWTSKTTQMRINAPLSEEVPEVAHGVPAVDGIGHMEKDMIHNSQFGPRKVCLQGAQRLDHLLFHEVNVFTVFGVRRRRRI